MADFGKLNFSVAFSPTSAFPLDARCYFTSMEAAQAAAATAQEVGSTDTVYFFGQKILVDDGETAAWYTIQRPGVLVAEGTGAGSESTVSLLIEGVDHAVDNVAAPEATGEDGEYSLEIM